MNKIDIDGEFFDTPRQMEYATAYEKLGMYLEKPSLTIFDMLTVYSITIVLVANKVPLQSLIKAYLEPKP